MNAKKLVLALVVLCLVVAVGSVQANILVADRTKVSEFSDSGQFVKTWASGFQFAWDIVADPAGNVYVSDQQSYKIQKFAADGTHIMDITTSYGLYPMGMAYIDGNIWDNANGYSASQGWNATTGDYYGRMFWGGDPYYMALGPDGNIYSSITGSSLVQAGLPGAGSISTVVSTIASPTGLAFYGNDLFIANGGGNIYRKSGETITTFASGLAGTLSGIRVSGNTLFAIEKWGGYGGYGKVSMFDVGTGQLTGYFDNYNIVGGGLQSGGYDLYLNGPNNLLVVQPVPEPSSIMALAMAGMGMAGFALRRRSR